MWKLSPKILFFFASLVIVYATKLECKYETSTSFTGIEGETVYTCLVFNEDILIEERLNIDSAEGFHKKGHTNRDVNGIFLGVLHSVKYFPRNLENIFGDLIIIFIHSTDIKEIKQQDIKMFTKLKSISLTHNKITTIDADLFKFNPDLRVIILRNNQISHIDPHTFDHLDNLTWLTLRKNQCRYTIEDAKSRSEVLRAIQQVNNGDCAESNILTKDED